MEISRTFPNETKYKARYRLEAQEIQMIGSVTVNVFDYPRSIIENLVNYLSLLNTNRNA